MAVKSAKAFLTKLKTDAGLQAKLSVAKTDDAKKKIVKGLGFDFTKDELKTAAEEIRAESGAELSDEELEAVAGGSSGAWVGALAGAIGAAAGIAAVGA
jgi:predicted ribosomally synthesized peptide with nif11-like leader